MDLPKARVLTFPRPHERKRRRTRVESMPPGFRDADQGTRSQGTLLESSTSPCRATNPGGSKEPPLSEPPGLSKPGSFLGRAEYLTPVDEDDAKKYSYTETTAFDDLSRQLLHGLRAFDLPSKTILTTFSNNCLDLCIPWMPIVQEQDLYQSDHAQPSNLLQQAVLVAGSRVSASSQAQAIGQRCYQRAKALVFCGAEADPLNTIRAMVLLQWWNPAGPEHVSTDASSFWLRMAVALAHQLGLHREPTSRQSNMALRRRLWWTLVVRYPRLGISC